MTSKPMLFAIGAVRDFHGQTYTATGRFERARRDGTIATILIWRSPCATCGVPFTVTTPATSPKFQPNRRCQKHKPPGHRVKGATT